jgi:hypothetical protein
MSAKVTAKNSAKPAGRPGKDTVYIDVEDEITAIIDKVESAKQNIVALVLPKRAAMLQSIVNMRLLKRSATTAGKSVVLITSEHALLPLAGAAGLHVAKNLQSKPEIPPAPNAGAAAADDAETPQEELSDEDLDAEPQKLDYNQPVGELAAVRDEPEEIALDNEAAAGAVAAGAGAAAAAKKPHKAGKGLKVPNFDKFRILLFGGIGALILLIIFFILASTVFPHAKITVSTTSTPVSLDTNFTASGSAKTLDEAKKIIPAVLKTLDQTASQQVKATGQKNLGEKATGDVTLKNCSDSAITVPAGTGISSNGLTFIAGKTANLDAGNFDSHGNCRNSGSHIGTVNVTAQTAGTKYNIGPSSFTVSGFSNVTGSSSDAMSGGTDNNVTILTQQDVDGAKQKISSADSDKFSKDFQKQLGDQGFYVFASTLKIADPAVTSTPAVGEQTDNATVNIKITYSVLAVQKNELKTLVQNALNKQIDQKKEKLSDSDVLNGLNVTVQSQNQANATLAISKDSTAVPILDMQAIKDQSKGKKTSEIKNYINTYPGVKDVDVKLSPFWVSHAPKNSGKIKVIQVQIKGK